jgi:hypothetical protein
MNAVEIEQAISDLALLPFESETLSALRASPATPYLPVGLLPKGSKVDLTTCVENILLAREAHFPATIANLYDPDNMPENLRRATEALKADVAASSLTNLPQ